MTASSAGLRRLDALTWLGIGAMTAVVLVCSAFGGFTVVLASYRLPTLVWLSLMTGAWYFRNHRKDQNLVGALETTAQVIAFAAVGAPLSYLAASVALPLQDATLDMLDRALGFDWDGMLAFLQQRPVLAAGMRTVYQSLGLQIIAIILVLGFTGRHATLRTFVLAFFFTALTTIAVSALLPAEGPWLHHGLQADENAMPASHTSWPVFLGVRGGVVRALTGTGSEGIITFPSLHAAMAVVLAATFWDVPVVRWFAVALNMLMLVATPIDGSHYLVDVLAGIAIAVPCLMAARALVRRVTASAPAYDLTAVDADVVPATR